jgi:5'(3')-deoxyribonucleotidase
MNKPNIFLDLDGMKFDTLPAIVSFVNDFFGIKSTIDEYPGNNIYDVFKKHLPYGKLTSDQFHLQMSKNFYSSIKHHETIMPMDNMCEVVSELSKKYNLYTVTARINQGLKVIEFLLNKHIPGCIKEIHCVHEYQPNGIFKADPKISFIERIKGRNIAFIDDTPEEIIRVQDIIPSYLFDPTNHHYSKKEIKNRVKNWEQIGKFFL